MSVLMIHWQIPIYCAERIPLLDIYLFSVSLYPDSSSLSLFPVWHCLNSQNSSDFTLLFVPRSHFLAPTFWSPCRQWFGRVFARSPLLLVCQLRLVLIFTHKQKQETQTCKIKKKKTIKTNYDKNICLYICVHLYIKDGMGHVEKLDKRTWCLKYNNLWKLKLFFKYILP